MVSSSYEPSLYNTTRAMMGIDDEIFETLPVHRLFRKEIMDPMLNYLFSRV